MVGRVPRRHTVPQGLRVGGEAVVREVTAMHRQRCRSCSSWTASEIRVDLIATPDRRPLGSEWWAHRLAVRTRSLTTMLEVIGATERRRS